MKKRIVPNLVKTMKDKTKVTCLENDPECDEGLYTFGFVLAAGRDLFRSRSRIGVAYIIMLSQTNCSHAKLVFTWVVTCWGSDLNSSEVRMLSIIVVEVDPGKTLLGLHISYSFPVAAGN
jgi:hypothetical protein